MSSLTTRHTPAREHPLAPEPTDLTPREAVLAAVVTLAILAAAPWFIAALSVIVGAR